MTYSIKEVAEKVGLSIYTLRFYDKKGLLPFVARNEAGYREFTEGDLNLIRTICCLKDTGMKIDDIRLYIDDVMAGPTTVAHRHAMLLAHRNNVLAKQRKIAENLIGIDFKLAMYGSPNAMELVEQERQFAINEKKQLGLTSAFEQ